MSKRLGKRSPFQMHVLSFEAGDEAGMDVFELRKADLVQNVRLDRLVGITLL
ncbi:MAG TPA: hypothetical protein VHQ01_12645 [Pyrinomonadaceae bacterium]|nr:hypothetical protein [Pyrinomonadaceae bacterium]